MYAILRNKTFFTDFAEAGGTAVHAPPDLLGLAEAAGIESLGGLTEEETEFLDPHQGNRPQAAAAANAQANMPKWLYDKLVAQYGEAEAWNWRRAEQPAPLDLRVNSIKATATTSSPPWPKRRSLAEPMPFAPLGLRVMKKPTLQNLPLFKDGAIEVQDEGSQVLAQIVGAARRDGGRLLRRRRRQDAGPGRD
jgi:16S rRNA (cytosine967-C5)-methyltransferase